MQIKKITWNQLPAHMKRTHKGENGLIHEARCGLWTEEGWVVDWVKVEIWE